MSKLIIGTNHLEDCDHVFAIAGTPVLSARLLGSRPSVTLVLPGTRGFKPIEVRENKLIQGPVVVDASTPTEVSLRTQGDVVVQAQLQNEDTIQLLVDFRPVGLNIYSDSHALYVGGATLSGNVFRRSKIAIDLGDAQE